MFITGVNDTGDKREKFWDIIFFIFCLIGSTWIVCSRTLRPLNDTSLGRHVSWTIHPLDKSDVQMLSDHTLLTATGTIYSFLEKERIAYKLWEVVLLITHRRCMNCYFWAPGLTALVMSDCPTKTRLLSLSILMISSITFININIVTNQLVSFFGI